jgi:hypothetical protein
VISEEEKTRADTNVISCSGASSTNDDVEQDDDGTGLKMARAFTLGVPEQVAEDSGMDAKRNVTLDDVAEDPEAYSILYCLAAAFVALDDVGDGLGLKSCLIVNVEPLTHAADGSGLSRPIITTLAELAHLTGRIAG